MTTASVLAALNLPRSRSEIAAIQAKRKPHAVRQAMRAPYFCGKLDHIRLDRLDDPEDRVIAALAEVKAATLFELGQLVCDEHKLRRHRRRVSAAPLQGRNDRRHDAKGSPSRGARRRRLQGHSASGSPH